MKKKILILAIGLLLIPFIYAQVDVSGGDKVGGGVQQGVETCYLGMNDPYWCGESSCPGCVWYKPNFYGYFDTYSNCVCGDDGPIVKKCSYTYKTHEAWGDVSYVISTILNNGWNGTDCSLTTRENIELVTPYGPICMIGPDDEGKCLAGKIYVPEMNTVHECFWKGDEGACKYVKVINEKTSEKTKPECLDWDEDGHGVEEYVEETCGHGNPRGGGDCDDKDDRVWRGCGLGITSLDLDFSDDYMDILEEEEVEVAHFTRKWSIGKYEECLQEGDKNNDGWSASQQIDCEQERVDAGLYVDEDAINSHGVWDEYPTPYQGVKVAIDGSEVVCRIQGRAEAEKWGNPYYTYLEKQMIHVELQKRDELGRPGDDWKTFASTTLSLTGEHCEVDLSEPAWDNKRPFNCNWTHKLSSGERGNSGIRCFAYPKVTGGGKEEYWESKNATSNQMGVAMRSSAFFPISEYLSRSINVKFKLPDQSVIEKTINLPPISIPTNTVLDDFAKVSSNAYIGMYSDTLASFEDFDKQIFSNDAHPPFFPPVKLRFFDAYAILKETSIENQYEVEHIYAIANIADIAGSFHKQFFWVGNFNSNKDVLVFEYPPDVYQPLTLPPVTVRRGTWPFGKKITFLFQPTNFHLGHRNICKSEYSIIGLGTWGCDSILAHEQGHCKKEARLCDEYSLSIWQKQKQVRGCLNEFPPCCLALYHHSCGTEEDCNGMPYIDRETPDRYGTNQDAWSFWSVMSNGCDNQIYPTTDPSNICPLRNRPYYTCQMEME